MSEKAKSRRDGVVMASTIPMTLEASLTWNGAAKVEKSSGATTPVGRFVTPSGTPMIAEMTMPQSRAPFTFMEYRTTVRTIEMMPTSRAKL